MSQNIVCLLPKIYGCTDKCKTMRQLYVTFGDYSNHSSDVFVMDFKTSSVGGSLSPACLVIVAATAHEVSSSFLSF